MQPGRSFEGLLAEAEQRSLCVVLTPRRDPRTGNLLTEASIPNGDRCLYLSTGSVMTPQPFEPERVIHGPSHA